MLSTLGETAFDSFLSRIPNPMKVVDSEHRFCVGTFESGKGVPILVSTGIEVENRGLRYAGAEHFAFFTEDDWKDHTRIRSDHGSWEATSLELTHLRELSLEIGKNRLVGHLSQHYDDLGVEWSGELDLSEGKESFLRFLAFNDETEEKLRWVADSTQSRQLAQRWGRMIQDNFLGSLTIEEDSQAG